MLPAGWWESEGDCLFPCCYLQLANTAPQAAALSPGRQTAGKATFSTISVLFLSEKTFYPVNLLAIGCFTLHSIMFPEKERVMKVPSGLTSNVFLDELQPGKPLGSFQNAKPIKPFDEIML